MKKIEELKSFVLAFSSDDMLENTDFVNEVNNVSSYKELVGVFLDYDVIEELEIILNKFFN